MKTIALVAPLAVLFTSCATPVTHLKVETAVPAHIFLVNRETGTPQVTDAGNAPVVLNLGRGLQFDYAIEVAFEGDTERFSIPMDILQRIARGKPAATLPKPDIGIAPSKERAIEIAKAAMYAQLVDPTSPLYEWGEISRTVRDSYDGKFQYCWKLSFRVNAKNRIGGYAGWEPHGAYFANGQLLWIGPAID